MTITRRWVRRARVREAPAFRINDATPPVAGVGSLHWTVLLRSIAHCRTYFASYGFTPLLVSVP